MLDGKRLIITGVVNCDSIAYAVADRAQALGAEILLGAFPRDRNLTESAAAALGSPPPVIDLDVTDPADLDRMVESVRERWSHIDGALHAVAFAPRETLAGRLADAAPEKINLAFQTSAVSLVGLANAVASLAPQNGASIVALDFDAARAWPVYNWMGVCKAALESVGRYLARDLGPSRIRVNLVAAGPLHTRAADGIPGFEALLEAWEHQSPMRWDPGDPTPVADAVCFLLSDFARAITGEILHVDGGYHAIAAPLSRIAEAPVSRSVSTMARDSGR
jgi:enoyl ACP reductase